MKVDDKIAITGLNMAVRISISGRVSRAVKIHEVETMARQAYFKERLKHPKADCLESAQTVARAIPSFIETAPMPGELRIP